MPRLTNRLHHLWPTLARYFVGFFFLVSAYLKLTEGFFFMKTAPLATDFEYWLSRGWTLPFYRPVLEFLMPYTNAVSALVILCHGLAACLLLFNVRTRIAGCILFFVQINIFFATCLGWGFLVMVGSSLWLALYFIVKPVLTRRSWRWMTLLFLVIYFLMILGRFHRGDPWLSEFPLNFVHFQEQVMGSHPLLKHWVILVSSTAYGPWIWASMWWMHVIIFFGLFTRYRLYAGVILGVLFAGRAVIWMNVLGAEAVVYMLLLFTWLAEEVKMQSYYGVVSLVPREELSLLKRGIIVLLEPPRRRRVIQQPKKKRR